MYIECLNKNEDGICSILNRLDEKKKEERKRIMQIDDDIPFSCDNCLKYCSRDIGYFEWKNMVKNEFNLLMENNEPLEIVYDRMYGYRQIYDKEDEIATIKYYACMIYLLAINHAELLFDYEFCLAVNNAMRCYIELPEEHYKRFDQLCKKHVFVSFMIEDDIKKVKFDLSHISSDENIKIAKVNESTLDESNKIQRTVHEGFEMIDTYFENACELIKSDNEYNYKLAGFLLADCVRYCLDYEIEKKNNPELYGSEEMLDIHDVLMLCFEKEVELSIPEWIDEYHERFDSWKENFNNRKLIINKRRVENAIPYVKEYMDIILK